MAPTPAMSKHGFLRRVGRSRVPTHYHHLLSCCHPLDSIVVPHLTSRVLKRPVLTSPTSQALAHLSQPSRALFVALGHAIGAHCGTRSHDLMPAVLTAHFYP
jgi:hypothetical protein